MAYTAPPTSAHPVSTLPSLLTRLSNWYDIVASERNIQRIERIIINLALAGFVLHLLLIFLTRSQVMYSLLGKLSTNYLKAIYTPFSIILFYEVLMLVVILPRSIATFIGKQYEIITLISIRRFFHDIADFDMDKPEIYTVDFLKEIGFDLGGALLMFFLTVVYYRIFAETRKQPGNLAEKRSEMVRVKKVITLILSGLLTILSIMSLSEWVIQVYQASVTNGLFPNPNMVFYKDFFSVMIFVDVFLLILSFIYAGTYGLIFRNAGFVISTILVRIALTAEKPFNLYFALTALLLGVLLMALFVFYNQKSTTELSDRADSDF